MTRFIYKYLSAHFIIKFGKIIPKNKNNPYYYEIGNLIEELSKVFGLTGKQLKYYIKGWVLKQDRNFDFKTYWLPKPVLVPDNDDFWENFTFPVVNQVFARTIATELVSVQPQPLEAPRGLLFYLDFHSENVQRPDRRNRNARVYPRETLNNAVQNQPLGELDHPNNSAADRMLNDWANLTVNEFRNRSIDELYRNQMAVIFGRG